jgi:hypothetical protein
MARFDELRRGDEVTLSTASEDTRGRVVSTSPDGTTAEVHWEFRPGFEHQVTREDAAVLRRVHESEGGMSA